METFSSRIGCFFLFIGAIMLLIFLGSDLAKDPSLELLCGAVPLLLLGFIFWKKGYSPPPPANRFRLLKKQKKDEPKR